MKEEGLPVELRVSSFGFPRRRFPACAGVVGALALQTLRQCIRRKVLFILLLFAAALLIGAGVIPSHEPVGRLYAIISLSLTLIAFFGVLVSVFLAATVLPEDRAKKTISTVMTKPVGKLNYLLGRVCGFAATMGIILAVMGVAAWGMIRWAGASAERRTGRADLLVGKRGLEPVEVRLHDGAEVRVLRETAEAAVLRGSTRQVLEYVFRAGVGRLPTGEQRLEMLPSIATGAETNCPKNICKEDRLTCSDNWLYPYFASLCAAAS